MNNFILEKAIEAWGSKLWSKEEYLELLPNDKKWKELVQKTINEIEAKKNKSLPYSEKPSQGRLYEYYIKHY